MKWFKKIWVLNDKKFSIYQHILINKISVVGMFLMIRKHEIVGEVWIVKSLENISKKACCSYSQKKTLKGLLHKKEGYSIIESQQISIVILKIPCPVVRSFVHLSIPIFKTSMKELYQIQTRKQKWLNLLIKSKKHYVTWPYLQWNPF